MDICTKDEAGFSAAFEEAHRLPHIAPPEGTPELSDAREDETHVHVDGQEAPGVAVSLHPLKISFYEAVAKQLLDDELQEVAEALCEALCLRANNLLPPDLLFTVFKAAAFQPSQDAAAAAAAAAAQSLLLKTGDSSREAARSPGAPVSNMEADGTPVAPSAATATAAVDVAASPASPSRSGSLAEGGAVSPFHQQQQRQQRQWQPLRPRPVPTLTEGDQQFVFNPYPNPEGAGNQGGGLTGTPDIRGLEAQVSATVVCSTSFKHACITTACTADASLVVGGGIDGSVRLIEVKEQQSSALGGAMAPPTGSSGKTRLLLTHDGPVNSVAIGPDSRLCFSGSSDTTVKVFDINPAKTKTSGAPLGNQDPHKQQQQQQHLGDRPLFFL